ncbi:MAG: hypothetical protein ABIZ91_10295 [Gemmatimonadaceae bacterium]
MDDIRLSDVVTAAGYAGEVSATLSAGDFGSVRVGVRRRDPNFRQLAEQPSFLTNDDLEISSTWRLDRLLPSTWGYALPLTVTHRATGVTPEFVTRSDVLGASVPSLRSPRSDNTVYTLSARRSSPLDDGWYSSLLNNIVMDGSVQTLGSRSEFQSGSAHDVNVAVDYSSSGFLGAFGGTGGAAGGTEGAEPGTGRTWRLPLPWSRGGSIPVNLSPSLVRVTSAVVRSSDSRASYLKPAAAFDDSVRVVSGLQELWRTVSTVEMRPFAGLTVRWDAVTVRDMRDYGDSTLNAVAAGNERTQLAGLDAGLERERSMYSSLTYAPVVTGWVRPRLVLGSSYSMMRDPNNRALELAVAPGDGVLPRLARRLGSTQVLTAGTTIDPAQALAGVTGEGTIWRDLSAIVRPIDVTFTRNQLSSYDGIPLTPGLGFQFGFGGIDDFRTLGREHASSAGASSDIVAGNSLVFPGGLVVTNRMQHTDARHWNRRLASDVGVVNGETVVYPDVALRWSGRPVILSGIFSSLGATARALHSRQRWTTPSTFSGIGDEVRQTLLRSYPLSANVVTAYGQVAISGAFALSRRVDSLPGSVARFRKSDIAADMSKSFPLPKAWSLKSPLRARVSWQESLTESFVSNQFAVESRSRLTDNGRRAFSVNADTDVADNMTFSLQGSRVVTFDRNFNRRFVQTVLTAVFQLQFFGGVVK